MGENEVEVELATNEPPIEYPYFVHIERRANGGTRSKATTEST
jgi:hypothetical protein